MLHRIVKVESSLLADECAHCLHRIYLLSALSRMHRPCEEREAMLWVASGSASLQFNPIRAGISKTRLGQGGAEFALPPLNSAPLHLN